jgi:DNA-binding CsgD family transcriptional regulator
MLESLRAYGAARLAGAGEQDAAALALAGYVLQLAEEADAGLQTVAGELAAARWLDAEDATTRQVLAWAREHDTEIALRLAVALCSWWFLRGRLPGNYLLLREAAGHAATGSDPWCAAQFWLGWAAVFSADLAGSLDHFTAVRDATGDGGPSRPLADALSGRAGVLNNLSRAAEAVDDGRRALAMAREIGYPAGELRALVALSIAAERAGDLGSAVQLARQAAQITQGIPGQLARMCNSFLARWLTEAGDLAAAEEICAAGLAQARDAGDLWNQQSLLTVLVILGLRAGRTGDAAAHLQETLQIGMRTGNWLEPGNALDCCGELCAVTERFAEAITLWAATDALLRHMGYTPDPAGAPRRDEELLRKARQALGPAPARAAQERGAAMSPATAAEFALLLTAPGPPQAAVPPGLGNLSARERELITLVARGATDAQIAEQLYISVRTVHSHLDRIRDKTGCRRRADLTRLALTTGLI